jgi:hypothetical protein
MATDDDRNETAAPPREGAPADATGPDEGPPSNPGERSLYEVEDPTGGSRIRSAADDPTAVWDEDSLHQAGMEGVQGVEGGPERGPATPPDVGGLLASGTSVEVSAAAAQTASPTEPAPPASSSSGGGLSWTATLLLAFGLGALVFTIFYSLR